MDMLLKRKDTLPQVGLSAKERLKNLKGAFKNQRKNKQPETASS